MVDARLERDTQILRLIRIATLTVGLVWVALMTFTDPDLWGHVRFGQDIVRNGGVSLVDQYSFTSDRVWINHEWLAEVVLYGIYSAAGAAGLVILKMLILTGVLACVLVVLHRRPSWRPADHDFLVTVALAGMMPRATSVRPQLFSLVFFAVLLLVLTTSDRRPQRLLAVPAIFCLWANLHGAYFVGLGILGLWIVVRAWQAPERLLSLAAVGVLSVAATLINPYGVGLWRFLRETVGTSRPEILDWAPAYSHPNLLLIWIIVLVTACVAVWRARRRVDPVALLIVAVLAAATLRISRLDAFFAIATVMLLGQSFGREPRFDASRIRWRPWVAVSAAVILVSAPVAFARQAACLDLEAPESTPLTSFFNLRPSHLGAPEPGAAAVLRQLHGRMLIFFDWGEYAIWHFPQLKVSIDGRRETAYSEAIYEAHGRFYRGASLELAARLNPDVVWIPRQLPVVQMLEQQGWREAFRGPVSVVLVRGNVVSTLVQRRQDWSSANRCFPAE